MGEDSSSLTLAVVWHPGSAAGQGAEGGFVRVSMEVLTPEQVQGNGTLAQAVAAAVAQHNGEVEQPAEQGKRGSKR